jgi:hypothetical protein
VECLEVGDQGVVDLAGEVALDAAQDLRLGHPLLGAPLGVGAGAWTPAHANDHGQVERPVRATVQPVPVGGARAGGDRRGPTQVREGRLAAQPLGALPAVTSSCPAWSTPIACSSSSPGAARPTSLASRWSARLTSSSSWWTRQATTRSAALVAWRGSARAVSSGRNRAQAATNAAVERPSSASRSGAGAVTSRPLSWLVAAVRALIAPLRAARSARIDSTMPSRRLAGGGGHPGQDRAGGGLGVDRVGLATLPAEPPVRPVDLHDAHPAVQQEPGQAGAVAAGAFDPDAVQVPVATKPAKQQLPVAATVGGELPVAQQPSLLVDDGGVVGAAVGVDAADDHPGAFPGALGHAGVAFPLGVRARTGTHRLGGRTHQ